MMIPVITCNNIPNWIIIGNVFMSGKIAPALKISVLSCCQKSSFYHKPQEIPLQS
jgi:hypothetical protein